MCQDSVLFAGRYSVKQMAEKTKKQKLDVVMGILLQLYLFFPWIVTEKGRASIHLYLLWIWEQKDPVQVYHWAFLKDMAELSENAETIAVWFLAAALFFWGSRLASLSIYFYLSGENGTHICSRLDGW